MVEEMDYLVIKLAFRKLVKIDFDSLILKAQGFTLSWGNKNLSMDGRITLINASLLPRSMYVMINTLVP